MDINTFTIGWAFTAATVTSIPADARERRAIDKKCAEYCPLYHEGVPVLRGPPIHAGRKPTEPKRLEYH